MKKRLISLFFVVLIIGMSIYLECNSSQKESNHNPSSVNREKSEFIVN